MFLPKFKGLVNEPSREMRAIVFIFVSNWQEGLLCHSGGYCCGWENLNLYDSPLWWVAREEAFKSSKAREKDEEEEEREKGEI